MSPSHLDIGHLLASTVVVSGAQRRILTLRQSEDDISRWNEIPNVRRSMPPIRTHSTRESQEGEGGHGWETKEKAVGRRKQRVSGFPYDFLNLDERSRANEGGGGTWCASVSSVPSNVVLCLRSRISWRCRNHLAFHLEVIPLPLPSRDPPSGIILF